MAYSGVVEDFRACCEGRQPSRVPVFALGLEFDMTQSGLRNADSRTDVEKTLQGMSDCVARFDYDLVEVFPDDYIEFEPLGLTMRDDPNHPAMVAEYLPMTAETLQGFTLPDPTKDMRLPIHLEMIRRAKATFGDTVCVMGRIAAPFSTLGLIYGIDTLLVKMLENPDLVHDNMAFFIEHQLAFGRAQLDAGADVLWLGDCVADSKFLRPEHFKSFAFDTAAAVARPITGDGGLVIYHTCETSVPHLTLQTQLPVSAVNVGEGASIAALRNELGTDMCLTGNFDPILLRDGTPEQVAESAEAMMRQNRVGGGYVFNTGEGVMANTPPENVAAMLTAARNAPRD